MARYAIVRKSTDMRWPNSKVEITASKRRAEAALNEEERYTYENPDAAKNWHHTLTEVYVLPNGWRKPTEHQLKRMARNNSTPTYPRTWQDELASEVYRVGVRLREGD